MLCLLVFLKARWAELAAYAGHLESAPLCLWDVWVVVIDPDGAVAQLGGYSVRGALVRGPDSTSKAVVGVIAQNNCFGFSLEGFYGDDWAEALPVLQDCQMPPGRSRLVRRSSRWPIRLHPSGRRSADVRLLQCRG